MADIVFVFCGSDDVPGFELLCESCAAAAAEYSDSFESQSENSDH